MRLVTLTLRCPATLLRRREASASRRREPGLEGMLQQTRSILRDASRLAALAPQREDVVETAYGGWNDRHPYWYAPLYWRRIVHGLRGHLARAVEWCQPAGCNGGKHDSGAQGP